MSKRTQIESQMLEEHPVALRQQALRLRWQAIASPVGKAALLQQAQALELLARRAIGRGGVA